MLKQPAILLLFNCFCFHIFSQSLSEKEELLATYMAKECDARTKDDSSRIRFAVRELHRRYRVREIRFVQNRTGSSHFIYPTRVMYINLSDTVRICDIWAGELTHAAQFAEDPLYYSFLALKGFKQALLRSLFLNREERLQVRELMDRGCKRWKAKIWVAYRRQYALVGSFEYDAHHIREMSIKSQVAGLLASN